MKARRCFIGGGLLLIGLTLTKLVWLHAEGPGGLSQKAGLVVPDLTIQLRIEQRKVVQGGALKVIIEYKNNGLKPITLLASPLIGLKDEFIVVKDSSGKVCPRVTIADTPVPTREDYVTLWPGGYIGVPLSIYLDSYKLQAGQYELQVIHHGWDKYFNVRKRKLEKLETYLGPFRGKIKSKPESFRVIESP